MKSPGARIFDDGYAVTADHGVEFGLTSKTRGDATDSIVAVNDTMNNNDALAQAAHSCSPCGSRGEGDDDFPKSRRRADRA